MGAKFSVEAVTVPTSGSTLDVSTSGFGTVVGVIVITSWAESDNTKISETSGGIGFACNNGAGTDQLCTAWSSQDGQSSGSTNTNHIGASDACAMLLDPVNDNIEYELNVNSWSAVTDGVRFNIVTNPAAAKRATVILIGGNVQLDVQKVVPDGTIGNTVNVDAGFDDPDYLICIGNQSNFTDSVTIHGSQALGMLVNDGSLTQRCMHFAVRNAAAHEGHNYARDDGIYKLVAATTNSVNLVRYEVTAIGDSPNSYTITTRDENRVLHIGVMAMKFPSGEEVLQHEWGVTATGNKTLTTTSQADFALVFAGTYNAWGNSGTPGTTSDGGNTCVWASIGAVGVDWGPEQRVHGWSEKTDGGGSTTSSSTLEDNTTADHGLVLTFVEGQAQNATLEEAEYDSRSSTTFVLNYGKVAGGFSNKALALTVQQEVPSTSPITATLSGAASISSATLGSKAAPITATLAGAASVSQATLSVVPAPVTATLAGAAALAQAALTGAGTPVTATLSGAASVSQATISAGPAALTATLAGAAALAQATLSVVPAPITATLAGAAALAQAALGVVPSAITATLAGAATLAQATISAGPAALTATLAGAAALAQATISAGPAALSATLAGAASVSQATVSVVPAPVSATLAGAASVSQATLTDSGISVSPITATLSGAASVSSAALGSAPAPVTATLAGSAALAQATLSVVPAPVTATLAGAAALSQASLTGGPAALSATLAGAAAVSQAALSAGPAALSATLAGAASVSQATVSVVPAPVTATLAGAASVSQATLVDSVGGISPIAATLSGAASISSATLGSAPAPLTATLAGSALLSGAALTSAGAPVSATLAGAAVLGGADLSGGPSAIAATLSGAAALSQVTISAGPAALSATLAGSASVSTAFLGGRRRMMIIS